MSVWFCICVFVCRVPVYELLFGIAPIWAQKPSTNRSTMFKGLSWLRAKVRTVRKPIGCHWIRCTSQGWVRLCRKITWLCLTNSIFFTYFIGCQTGRKGLITKWSNVLARDSRVTTCHSHIWFHLDPQRSALARQWGWLGQSERFKDVQVRNRTWKFDKIWVDHIIDIIHQLFQFKPSTGKYCTRTSKWCAPILPPTSPIFF